MPHARRLQNAPDYRRPVSRWGGDNAATMSMLFCIPLSDTRTLNSWRTFLSTLVQRSGLEDVISTFFTTCAALWRIVPQVQWHALRISGSNLAFGRWHSSTALSLRKRDGLSYYWTINGGTVIAHLNPTKLTRTGREGKQQLSHQHLCPGARLCCSHVVYP